MLDYDSKAYFSFVGRAVQLPKHMNFGKYVALNVPSLKGFSQVSANLQNGTFTLKAVFCDGFITKVFKNKLGLLYVLMDFTFNFNSAYLAIKCSNTLFQK